MLYLMVFENANKTTKFTIIVNTTLSGSTEVLSNVYYEGKTKQHIDILMPIRSLPPSNDIKELINNFIQIKNNSERVQNPQEIYIVCVPEMGHSAHLTAKIKMDDAQIFFEENRSGKPDFTCVQIEKNANYPLNIV